MTTDKIYLVGFMAAGKSTVARALGQRLHWRAEDIDELIERGNDIVRKLDAIVRNKYANNVGVLAEWTSASHTERAPRKKTEPTPSTSPSAPQQ